MRSPLTLLALTTCFSFGFVPFLQAQAATGRCLDATLDQLKACEVDVLSASGLFCPGNQEIRNRICDRLRNKQGEQVNVRCEGPGECTSRNRISGSVTRVFEIQREKLSCNVHFRIKITAILAGTGMIGRCGPAAASTGSLPHLQPAVKPARARQEPPSAPDGEAGTVWLEPLVEEAVDEALLLPTLERGKVEGGDRKANALLETVLEDYRRLGARPGVELPIYTVVATGAGLGNAIAESGELRETGLASGLYTLVLDRQLDRVTEALVLASWREAGARREARLHLVWDGRRWDLREARRDRGSGDSPPTPVS